MPYGDQSSGPVANTVVKKYDSYPPQQLVMQQYHTWAVHRNGTNRNSGLLRIRRPGVNGYYVKYIKRIYRNSPNRITFWDPNQKRFRTKKAPILLERVRWVPTKSGLLNSAGLMPNDFQASGYTVSGDLDNRTLNCSSFDGHSMEYFGSLFSNFDYTLGGPADHLAGGPHGYMSSVISSRFDELVTAADNRCRSKFYEKAKNQTFNISQMIGERRQTASMVLDLSKRLIEITRLLRSGNVYDAAKILFPTNPKCLANDWLVFQYGIRPLLADLHAMGVTLSSSGVSGQYYDIRVKVREKASKVVLENPTRVVGVPAMEGLVTSEGHVDVIYKARISISSSALTNAKIAGFTAPQSLLWELTPYSFVADWFIPIGSYLNNVDAFSGLSVHWVTKTVVKQERLSFLRTFGGPSLDGWNTPQLSLKASIQRYDITRTLLSEVPPLPYPSFKDPASVLHIANAVALLVQKAKR